MRNFKLLWLGGMAMIALLIIWGRICFIATTQQLFDIGMRAYIYAYPLVLMDITQRVMTHEGKYANRFIHVTEFPTDAFKTIVRPNVDTLYSFAWLDLRKEPVIISVPDTHDRYYLIECMDAWTNVFASLGKRTTGTAAQQWVMVGPDWQGEIPKNMRTIRAPTNMVLLLARTQTYGKQDYEHVRAIQSGYEIIPVIHGNAANDAVDAILSAIKKEAQRDVLHRTEAAVDVQKSPVDQVAAMDALTFYTTFIKALEQNRPAKIDAAMVDELQKIDIVPGKAFNPSQDLGAILQSSMKIAIRKIAAQKYKMPRINGWGYMLNIGTYGTDYLTRALVANIGIGANLPEDAVYPTAFVDAQNRPLLGTHAYRIHFTREQIPPVNAFWSITLYDSHSFLVNNPLQRFSLNNNDPLQFNQDGSLDIYIQHRSPGKDKENNWLPAPEGAFNLTMRLYWPQQSVLNGTWQPPAIERYE